MPSSGVSIPADNVIDTFSFCCSPEDCGAELPPLPEPPDDDDDEDEEEEDCELPLPPEHAVSTKATTNIMMNADILNFFILVFSPSCCLSFQMPFTPQRHSANGFAAFIRLFDRHSF
jgi:hypothetical protein